MFQENLLLCSVNLRTMFCNVYFVCVKWTMSDTVRPSWPVMVTNRRSMTQLVGGTPIMMKSSSDSILQMRASREAANMWVNTRHKRKEESTPSEALVSRIRFAPKVVRQCKHCQILYTNFHCCRWLFFITFAFMWDNDEHNYSLAMRCHAHNYSSRNC